MKGEGDTMKKLLILFVMLPLWLFAYSDNDLDGVDDKDDLCPNTSLIEIVDDTGCTIEYLTAPDKSASYDVVFGVGYAKNSSSSQESKTNTQSLQIDYFYKKFSLQLQTSHFSTSSKSYDNSGMSDSYLGLYYRVGLSEKLKANVGARLNIPTYKSNLDNNNLDYTLSASFNYRLEKFTLLCGLGYTIVNDDDIDNELYKLKYQNTFNYHIGLGYYVLPRLYANISYTNSKSIYAGDEDLTSASFYGHYSFDEHWFSTISYSKGLSDTTSDYTSSLRIGYYF